MRIRPFADGDDLALGAILPDPQNPAAHMARALLRPDTDAPVSRACVAQTDEGDVLIGAAALAASPSHPTRAWAHVEVAPTDRCEGVGTQLLRAVRQAAAGTELASLALRARVQPGTPGAQAATAWGFTPLFRTRVVRIAAGALAGLGADRLEDFTVTATGSVALTQAFADWYAGVNRADPAAPMSLGQVNARFLSEHTGAHGAALMRRDGEVTAFAVSFPSAEGDTELTVGAVLDGSGDPIPQTSEWEQALEDVGALIARLSADTAVTVEVTDEMPVLSALVDGVLSANKAEVVYEYLTVGTSEE